MFSVDTLYVQIFADRFVAICPVTHSPFPREC
jgi:hypothetical protein